MLSQEQFKEFSDKFGKEFAEQQKSYISGVEKAINDKMDEVRKGAVTQESFESFKKDELQKLNENLAAIERLEGVVKDQGNKINQVLAKASPNSIKFEDFVAEKMGEMKGTGKFVEFTASQLKAAGIQSIGNTISPSSPYAPGIGGELEIFDIARNPNFITSKVNLGRTNQSILAWANEKDFQGGPAIVAEGGLKPQAQHIFEVETSKAKKIAEWSEFTDEFDQDLPGFATKVRRMIEDDVVRGWDDGVQTDVQAAAKRYIITALDDQIQSANKWDALYAMMGQVGYYNFTPNTAAINWLTNVMLKTLKNVNDSYLVPSFAQELANMIVYANKMAPGWALVGDLRQYNVDIYKEFTLKIGFINDEFIYNKYAVVGEMRYHSYISDARKWALVYDSLEKVATQIDGAPHSQ